MMDFLRTADKVYLGLTPAQYMSIIMFMAGIAMFVYLPAIDKKHKNKNKKIKSAKKKKAKA